ncbi:macoilin-1 [Patella vulgata]|uniref:macoilin-1 n=1 Tax=Patella vulgata TaxID=6465 RepID=UPI0021803A7C|nr:macoilin-1 [Patella vulgata]
MHTEKNMKRPRNVDCGKLRRPMKRSKITDGIYGSTFLYMRFLLVWALVLMADFILEFRFEYLWPFWLLLRSVYDSFKYQGLAFSVFFVCIAITSDVVCYLFIPVQWLFFAASTYVWVQYVWHTERGICLPTVSLWLLFVYIEASVRLRELKSLPFNLDLCRPFAAHCIGYPVVTLGFGFKSYISYRLRLRRQKVVQKENDFYTQLLSQSLPLELQYNADKHKALTPKPEEEVISNGVAGKKVKVEEEKDKEKDRDKDKEREREKDNKKQTKSVDINEADEVEFIEKSWQKKSNVNQFNENVESSEQQTKSFKTSGMAKSAANKLNSSKENSANKKSKNYSKDLSPASFTNNKDEVILRLESDIKKIKSELQSSRNQEQELRSQINNLVSGEKSQHSEIYQLQQDNDNLQNKLHNLVTSRQQDKQNIAILEKKLIEERKLRTSFEQQLAAERKAKKVEDAAAARAVAMASASRNECTESCKARRRESENDVKLLRRDLKLREDQYRNLDVEIQTLRQIKDNQKENVLMAALGAMQEKNTELENSLTAETRFKQELFSALAEERRQIKVLQISVAEREAVIVELKSKIAEVMALIPSTTTYQSLNSERTSSPLFSAKLCQEQFPAPVTISNLNPNASDYTPKMAI